MKEEKMKILKMLEEKKISSAEAAELLDALKESGPEKGGKAGKTLKIKIYEGDLSKPKVDLNIPLNWTKFLFPSIKKKIGEKIKDKGFDFDIDSAFDSIEKGSAGKIVDIEDGGNKVEIYIE